MPRTAALSEKERLRAQLESVRRQLFEAVSGLTEEQMRRRPAEGEWSVAEVLAHLPESERHACAQARAVHGHPGAAVAPLSDDERAQAAARGRRLAPPALIHDLVAARWETTRLLAGLQARSLSLSGRHHEIGEVTVARVLGSIADHEGEHVEQIDSARKVLGL